MSYPKILMISAVIISVMLPQCSPDGEKRFSSGAGLYNNGRTEDAVKEFEEGMISFISIKSLSDADIKSCDNALYVRDAEKIKIIYPVKIKIELPADYNIISFDPISNRLAATNCADIKIFDAEGSLIKIISPIENVNKNIKSVLLNGDNIIYYIDSIIYTCNINTGEAKTVTGAKFESPVADTFYSVRFYLSNDTLAAAAGIAGVYYLSVIDLAKNAVLIKNREIASCKLFFSGDDIYYISGKSGNWTLNQLTIKTNNIRRISGFTDISDVEFSDAGIMIENNPGIWFLKYDGDRPDRIPFNYRLAGGCGGYTLLRYKDEAYVSDMKLFRDKLYYLKNSAPLIFSDKKEDGNSPR